MFVGVTAQTAGDRRQTPYLGDAEMPGVEIHANVFETLASRQFLVNAPPLASFVICLLLVIGMGAAFARRSYAIGAGVAAATAVGRTVGVGTSVGTATVGCGALTGLPPLVLRSARRAAVRMRARNRTTPAATAGQGRGRSDGAASGSGGSVSGGRGS